jgi:hypothetical protein
MEFLFKFDDGCQADGVAKLSYNFGEISIGNLSLGNREAGFFHLVTGSVFDSTIQLMARRNPQGDKRGDSLFVTGVVDETRSSAKGVFQHVGSSREGDWTSRSITCGAWTPNPSLSSCISE